jgi:alpha-D-xyloside xylohydrolase
MKFTEGVWNAREDIHVTSAVEVLELATHLDDSASSARNPPSPEPFIRTLCASRHIKHRGDLISKPVITVTLTSPAPGIIGIEAKHFYGHPQYNEPKATLFPDGKPKFGAAQVQVKDETATIISPEGKASATLDLRPSEFCINIRDAQGKYVAGLGKDTIQWILHNAATPLLAEKENASQTIHDLFHRSLPERRSYMAMSMGLEAGELVYGLGERFGPFIKNGQAIESSNDDGGSSSSSGGFESSLLRYCTSTWLRVVLIRR